MHLMKPRLSNTAPAFKGSALLWGFGSAPATSSARC